ncbi:hypothetical protein F5Y16DRAFT_398246 [Xylariaceae sp. FL0255]|nr:hypothetical protein F5Y16DRAFT_398246 [Xylariaceae sp. FL0255]
MSSLREAAPRNPIPWCSLNSQFHELFEAEYRDWLTWKNGGSLPARFDPNGWQSDRDMNTYAKALIRLYTYNTGRVLKIVGEKGSLDAFAVPQLHRREADHAYDDLPEEVTIDIEFHDLRFDRILIDHLETPKNRSEEITDERNNRLTLAEKPSEDFLRAMGIFKSVREDDWKEECAQLGYIQVDFHQLILRQKMYGVDEVWCEYRILTNSHAKMMSISYTRSGITQISGNPDAKARGQLLDEIVGKAILANLDCMLYHVASPKDKEFFDAHGFIELGQILLKPGETEYIAQLMVFFTQNARLEPPYKSGRPCEPASGDILPRADPKGKSQIYNRFELKGKWCQADGILDPTNRSTGHLRYARP